MTVLIKDWRIVQDGEGSTAAISVMCPGCEKYSHLDHEVDSMGFVRPSLQCARDDCDFHDMVRLDNWNLGFWRGRTK